MELLQWCRMCESANVWWFREILYNSVVLIYNVLEMCCCKATTTSTVFCSTVTENKVLSDKIQYWQCHHISTEACWLIFTKLLLLCAASEKSKACYGTSPGNLDCIILHRAQWDSRHSNSWYTFNNFCSAAASELEPAHLTQCSDYMPVTLWGTATCLKLSSSKIVILFYWRRIHVPDSCSTVSRTIFWICRCMISEPYTYIALSKIYPAIYLL